MNSTSVNYVSETGINNIRLGQSPIALFRIIRGKIAAFLSIAQKSTAQIRYEMKQHAENRPLEPGSLSSLSIAEKQRFGLYHLMD